MDSASERVWLVSPYVTLDKLRGFTRSIESAIKRGVVVHLVVRAPDKSTRHSKEGIGAIRDLVGAGLKLYTANDLHAKIYISEKYALVTSLNLLESSFSNSIEIGMWVPTSRPEVVQIREFFEREIRSHMKAAKPEDLVSIDKGSSATATKAERAEPVVVEGRERSARKVAKPTAMRAAKAKGYCLRCSERIPPNPERPYCDTDYEKWAKYSEENYEDNNCHICGADHPATMRKPLCPDCFEAA